MKYGIIGDDFTGSSDIGNTLARQGLRTALFAGCPNDAALPDLDALVIALKIRTVPVDQAIKAALDALDWLRRQGCERFIYKICSTFDSTDAGNIGPVTEALADALGAACVPVCPAFPDTGRTVFNGHLFVGDQLLSNTGMATHPLTPMNDPDLRRVLSRQCKTPAGHLSWAMLQKPVETARKTLHAEAEAGRPLVICDAIADDDLRRLGRVSDDLPLLTGASGLGLCFAPETKSVNANEWTPFHGPAAVLSGSVSSATQTQVAAHGAAGHPVKRLNPAEIMSGTVVIGDLTSWVMSAKGLPLITTTADPQAVADAQHAYGRDAVAAGIERFFAELAIDLVAAGVRRLITAGGETSGAVVEALAPGALEIGPEIDPGVPALRTSDGELGLALKSGNFGGADFFEKAAKVLATPA